jgi:hypothetical protein
MSRWTIEPVLKVLVKERLLMCNKCSRSNECGVNVGSGVTS